MSGAERPRPAAAAGMCPQHGAGAVGGLQYYRRRPGPAGERRRRCQYGYTDVQPNKFSRTCEIKKNKLKYTKSLSQYS